MSLIVKYIEPHKIAMSAYVDLRVNLNRRLHRNVNHTLCLLFPSVEGVATNERA